MSADGERVLAGTRLQSGPEPEGFPLYKAVGEMDVKISPWLKSIIPEGTIELNGMWNSIELAGMGLGVEWMVQSAMASMSMLDLRNLLALTSPVPENDETGWVGPNHHDEFGDEGYFKYPTEKLRASIEHFIFPDDLPKSVPEVKVFMEGIWEAPIGHVMHFEGPKGKLKVIFNFSI